MLTSLSTRAKFRPIMMQRKIKFIFIVVSVIALQSCYTMLYPPATLPNTVTTVTAAPAVASSLGGLGYYGWDPYWEPTLPFTSYHRGYGASYYNPYNYYDYRDPYYAPVYIVSEAADPVPGRKYGRNDDQGGSRTRVPNSPSVSSGSSHTSSSVSTGGSTTIAAPIKNEPVKSVAVVPIPKKPTIKKDVKAGKPSRETKPAKQVKTTSSQKRKKTDSTKPDEPKKRVRTRN